MEFIDLSKQYFNIKKDIDKSINLILKRGNFILGKEVKILEDKIAQYCRVKYAVGVNSGTDALLLSLKALGIGLGDEVITTSFSFIATAETIALLGAKPVFTDINPLTFNIDGDKIEKTITAKTKAIIPVHLYGQPAEMNKIIKLAKKYKLFIIEDAAQAIGAKHKGKLAGSFGQAGCLSFFPTKNLGAYGDGGMVLTNNKNLAGTIRALRAHGAKKKYYHNLLGVNSRLDTIQASILKIKLKYLNKWTEEKRRKAKIYNRALNSIPQIKIPSCQTDNYHVYHQYTIRANHRNKLQKYLKTKNIPTAIHYPTPLHLQPVFRYLGYKRGSLPESEKAAREVLSLPIFPELTLKEQEFIITQIKNFYK
jgi:dTDP-4-amino-4,6-dideoxygalactose transaminase